MIITNVSDDGFDENRNSAIFEAVTQVCVDFETETQVDVDVEAETQVCVDFDAETQVVADPQATGDNVTSTVSGTTKSHMLLMPMFRMQMGHNRGFPPVGHPSANGS